MGIWTDFRSTTAKRIRALEEGIEARLVGWVARKREHGKKIFILLREGSGFVQIVGDASTSNQEAFKAMKVANLESAVAVVGRVAKDARAPHGVELNVRDFRIVAGAEPWPITSSALKSPGYLFDMRHLSIRGMKNRAIILIRAEMLRAAQRYFEENGYVWVQAPTFITSACEGGATLFTVPYFGLTAYLTQSAQFYEEATICSLERVYIIQPSFRSEKSRTRKHLTEFWHVEAEAAFFSHKDIMALQESLLREMIKAVVNKRQEELSLLGVRNLEPPKPPFSKITYDKALDLLRDIGIDMKWGEDFGAVEEKRLSEQFDEPFFVTCYPLETRSFYHMHDPKNPVVTLSSDLMAPGGYGEITTGGERISDYNLLLSRIAEEDLNVEDYRWYLDLRKYGMPQHSGFGLGLERTLRWSLGLEHIRQTTLFPRTPSRVYP